MYLLNVIYIIPIMANIYADKLSHKYCRGFQIHVFRNMGKNQEPRHLTLFLLFALFQKIMANDHTAGMCEHKSTNLTRVDVILITTVNKITSKHLIEFRVYFEIIYAVELKYEGDSNITIRDYNSPTSMYSFIH